MDHFQRFINLSSDKTLREYRTKSDKYWRNVGEKMALGLFKDMSKRVPAYKNFLKKHNIDPSKIKTTKDFKKVPAMDKDNYIHKYKLNELCWDGKVESSYFLSASSGSTGVPYFWPRSTEQALQGASISELIYKEYFQADKKSTLYIVAFAMGTWIAGTYMMMSTVWVAEKGYPITVVTPGGNKEEILRLVKMGSKYYDQIILIGYPPFIKDVVDGGIEQGVDWKKINVKFMFSGEAVTEGWREHLQAKTGFKNILTGSVNIYGSADVGLVAHETAVTTFIRRKAVENKKILEDLFHAERVPSVNQFDPSIRYFEKNKDGELLISAPSGIPLVRYNTKDFGDILYFDEAKVLLQKHGVNIDQEFKKQKIQNLLWKAPMVYLFGRGKFTAIIYGANVYPEHVKIVTEHKSLEKDLTGKFVIITEERKDHSQELNLHVELSEKSGKGNAKLKDNVKKVFIQEVPKTNSEYNYVMNHFGSVVYPKIILHEYGDPQYFPRGIVKKLA